MTGIQQGIDTLNRLEPAGISLSMDDYGTGYSSLSCLHKLPNDELKIDQSFVRNLSSSAENAAIVATIIAMAQQLNLEIVARGIEARAELKYPETRRCDYFQGYHFARPVPFEEFCDERKSRRHIAT